MDFLQRNLFRQLRASSFDTKEEMEPMTTFKQKKIAQMMHNLQDIPEGECRMSNRLLNHRLAKIEEQELHAMDTSIESIELLKLIIVNVNCALSDGINLNQIIRLGTYLRTSGDKVDFVKIDTWLQKLRMQRMAQLMGSVLIYFFQFEQDEIPFVRRPEPGAKKLTLRSLYYNINEHESIRFKQGAAGLVHTTGGTMRKSINRSMRYFSYAPIESTSSFLHNLFKSISEIEE